VLQGHRVHFAEAGVRPRRLSALTRLVFHLTPFRHILPGEKEACILSKLAAFQFYPGDWLKDPALSICSPGARGVWMDVLCLMFESPKRGYLVTNHQPWTLKQLSEALRGHASANLLFLKELVRNGVMKHDKKRGYFSARLVQDERNRETWRSEKRRQLIKNKRSHSGTNSTPVPPDLHSSSSSSNLTTKTPLPPASAGGSSEQFFEWARETIGVQMGRHRRLPNLDSYQGGQAKYVVEFLNSRGFPARIVTAQ